MIEKVLTNLEKHNSDSFCYMVHGLLNEREPYDIIDRYRCCSLVGCVKQPDSKILENYSIFGGYGAVVETHNHSILMAWPLDTGLKLEDPVLLEKLKRASKKCRDELIRPYTDLLSSPAHNEVICMPKKVKGVVCCNLPDSPKVKDKAEKYAKKHDLPLIKIPAPKLLSDEEFSPSPFSSITWYMGLINSIKL